jgi:prepilin-type N-terminal cleavage/methylation domain-containing protein
VAGCTSGLTKAMKSHKAKQGMTLVEILIVVAVVVILATMVFAIAARIDNQTKEKGLKNTLALLESALQEYYEYWRAFPDPNKPPYLTHSAALYGQLQSTPSSRQIVENIDDSFIKNNPDAVGIDMPELYDPWGTVLDYRYVLGDTFPELISAGRDKMFATADDISSKIR